jgi:hypothetical protein
MVDATTPQARIVELRKQEAHLERALSRPDGLPHSARTHLRDKLADVRAELHRLARLKS